MYVTRCMPKTVTTDADLHAMYPGFLLSCSAGRSQGAAAETSKSCAMLTAPSRLYCHFSIPFLTSAEPRHMVQRVALHVTRLKGPNIGQDSR